MLALVFLIFLAGEGHALSSSCQKVVYDGTYYGPSNLGKAIFAQDYECVKEVLAQGANLNEVDRSDYTPAIHAAIQGNAAILELILAYGGKGDYAAQGRTTPMLAASSYGNTEVLKVLVNAGYSTVVDDSAKPDAADYACDTSSDGACSKSTIKNILDEPVLLVTFGMDFPSAYGVLNDGKRDKKSSNRECNALCMQTTGCKAWTRIRRSTEGGSQEGECWLRSHQPKAKRCGFCDSGTPGFLLYNQTEYRSEDIIGYDKPAFTRIYTDKLCASLCYANSDCRGWTRIVTDKQYNKAGECWLRYSAPEKFYCKECTSGSIDRN